LQQGIGGYTGSEDTYIYQYAPDGNYCTRDYIKVGRQEYAALLRFDLTGIPAGATVTDAALHLYATGWSGADITIRAYYITRSVSIYEATWNQAQAGNPWGQPGCEDTSTDRRAAAESTVTTHSIGRWYDFDLTAVVQGWVNGLVNNGVLLRTTTPAHSFSFASSENGAAIQRPKLVLTYRTSAAPTPTPATTPTLVIGHITDAHIGATWLYTQRLPGVVSLISQQAQVMVDTGDCTQNGTAEESIEYMQLVTGDASIPWRAVLGNHDTPAVFEQHIGPLAWSWDVGGYRLIGINTEAINYTALDQALTHEKPCIVFGHFPLSWCNPPDQIKLRQRFKVYNVPIYIAGHTHLDSLETDPQSGTVLLTGQRAGLGHYRLITMRGSTVEDITFESMY